jgi:hypothetical protein
LAVVCLVFGSFLFAGCSHADPLTDALDKALAEQFGQATKAGKDQGVYFLTEVAEPFIPTNVLLDTAIKMLESSGFKVMKARDSATQEGMDARFVGTKTSSFNYRSFSYFLYEVILEVKGGAVARMWTRAAFKAL